MWIPGTIINNKDMMTEHKLDYYLGTITGIVDNTEKPNPEADPIKELLDGHTSQEHIAVATIPGISENIKIYPGRNQIDEPRIGDKVIIAVWDPIYNSYCTYEKLKEDNFVGIRAHGKLIDINHEKITIGVYEEPGEYDEETTTPDVTQLAHLEITKEGAITIHAAQDITINGDTNCTITIQGDCNLNVSGNTSVKTSGNTNLETSGNTDIKSSGNMNINASGSCKINSPDVTVSGGQMTIRGTATPNMQGPFCGVPNCIFSGAPHSGSLTTTS